MFSKLAAIVAVMIVGRLNCLAENDPGTYPPAADDDPVESERQIDYTFHNINYSQSVRNAFDPKNENPKTRLADDMTTGEKFR